MPGSCTLQANIRCGSVPSFFSMLTAVPHPLREILSWKGDTAGCNGLWPSQAALARLCESWRRDGSLVITQNLKGLAVSVRAVSPILISTCVACWFESTTRLFHVPTGAPRFSSAGMPADPLAVPVGR